MHMQHAGFIAQHKLATYPGLFFGGGGGKKRAWYTLTMHARDFHSANFLVHMQ